MDYLLEGIRQACLLLFTFNGEVYRIILLSLWVSISATMLASCVAVPTGIYLGLATFRGQRLVARTLYTLMSIPTVVVGLMVALLISRRGPLGFLGILYTPAAMVMAQTILVIPLITGLTYSMIKHRGHEIRCTGITLGARGWQLVAMVAREMRGEISINIIAAFSRAISEVGAVMIVGGNIHEQTRTITTAIALMNSMGDYAKAIALGIVLLLISFVVNSVVYSYKEA